MRKSRSVSALKPVERVSSNFRGLLAAVTVSSLFSVKRCHGTGTFRVLTTRSVAKGVAQPGSPDDLNSDGFINLFEGNAAVGRSVGKGVAQPGSPDDLNGDGFINLFEGNAAVGK